MKKNINKNIVSHKSEIIIIITYFHNKCISFAPMISSFKFQFRFISLPSFFSISYLPCMVVGKTPGGRVRAPHCPNLFQPQVYTS